MARKFWSRLIMAPMIGAVMMAPGGAAAQSGQNGDKDVVVTGTRSKPSNWRQAETNHVVLLSDGSEADLVRMARNLEWLHFLLSGLMGRDAGEDDLVKMHVTLIGDVAQFEQMDLHNTRWQQGPFSDLFRIGRYYDPREDGAVMASTRVDQRVVVQHTPVNAESVRGLVESMARTSTGSQSRDGMNAAIGIGNFDALSGLKGPFDQDMTFGEKAIQVSAESLLYAGYAQHWLLSYFPAAYPRWYLDGFGQIFSTIAVDGNKAIEFGRAPQGARTVIEEFGSFPIKDVLNDSYLTKKPGDTRWTPIHAWMLTHFLFFSDTRRPQLRKYLAARAQGADAATAAAVFGDQTQLTSELRRYFSARKTYVKVSYDGAKIEQPLVRRLRESEAAFVKGRLELGARVVIPPAPAADAAPNVAKAMTKARDNALAQRAKWLNGLRRDASRWSGELGAQLLLAEAECRSGNAAECLAAANRAEAISPDDTRMLVWKGTAMILQSASLAGPERKAKIAEGRRLIIQANQADHDAVGPLLANYDSYAKGGEAPSDNALDGLQKVIDEVPAAPETRLALAKALVDRGDYATARPIILPVAAGPYDTPERPAAQSLLSRMGPSARSDDRDRGISGGETPPKGETPAGRP
jgi:hypothetical protein